MFVILKIMFIERLSIRYWFTLPIIYLLKIGWCLVQLKGFGNAKNMNGKFVDQHPLVWVVIPTWNRHEDILACIESVMASNYPTFHVVIVDNASTDGTSDNIKQKYPNIELITLEANRGAAYASNRGIEFAIRRGARYILRLDSDVVIDSEIDF